MFDIGWGDFLVLILAALFILGPERLPGAASALGRTVRQARQYASKAQEQLRSELGSDFDELREPLADLKRLRDINPRQTITRHLLDATGGYDPREDLRVDLRGQPATTSATAASATPASATPASATPAGATPTNATPTPAAVDYEAT